MTQMFADKNSRLHRSRDSHHDWRERREDGRLIHPQVDWIGRVGQTVDSRFRKGQAFDPQLIRFPKGSAGLRSRTRRAYGVGVVESGLSGARPSILGFGGFGRGQALDFRTRSIPRSDSPKSQAFDSPIPGRPHPRFFKTSQRSRHPRHQASLLSVSTRCSATFQSEELFVQFAPRFADSSAASIPRDSRRRYGTTATN